MKRTEPPISQIAATLTIERKRAGLSISEVAKQAKIAKSTLSQLENGVGNPSIETLWAICIVLDIPVSRLLESPKANITVIKRGKGTTVSSDSQNYQATLLASCPPNVRRDIYWIEVKKGEPHYSDAHQSGVIEHVVITKGAAKLGLTNESYELGEGDYISYPGDQAHVFEALSEVACAMLISEYR